LRFTDNSVALLRFIGPPYIQSKLMSGYHQYNVPPYCYRPI